MVTNPNTFLNRVKKSTTPQQEKYTSFTPTDTGISVTKGTPLDSGISNLGKTPPTQQPVVTGKLDTPADIFRQKYSNQGGFNPVDVPQTATTPTPQNPVVEEVPAKPNTSNVDYSAVDNLDTQGLYRFIDNIQVRAAQGEQISAQDQLLLREAQRKVQQSLNPATVQNAYEGQISEQQKQREAEAIRLKAIEEANISAEEKRLNALYAQRAAQAQDAGKRTSQAAAKATSFSGFGRSTFNADQQVQIQDAVNQNLAMLDAEKSLAIERYRAQQAGATAEQLSEYDNRISQLRDKSTQFQLQQAEQINAFNQQNAATYEEKINNLLQYASQWTDPKTPLTEQELATAKAYGQIAIDKDGNVNTALLKEIDPKLMGEVIRSAAEARGAIPTNEFGFINVGGGLVAITDPTTGEVRYEQGQVPREYQLEKIGDTGYAFDPTTGKATQRAGKITATGDLRGLANQYPGQAWAKNNNPGGITWGAASDSLKQARTDAGISFGQGTARPSGEGGSYVDFPTIEDGLAAQWIALSRGGGDINARLQKRVGTSEGPNYAAQVMNMAGIQNGTKFTDLTDQQAQALQMAVIKKESPGFYSLISQGGATGTTPQDKTNQELITRIDRIQTALKNTILPRGSVLLDPDLKADVDYIKNNLMLKTFAEAKASGVTFGAASNAEWEALKNAATSIKWTMSQDALNTELDRLKTAAGGVLSDTTTTGGSSVEDDFNKYFN